MERLDNRAARLPRQLLRGRVSVPRGEHHRVHVVLPLDRHQPLPHAGVQPLPEPAVVLRSDPASRHVHAVLQRGAEDHQEGHPEHDRGGVRLLVDAGPHRAPQTGLDERRTNPDAQRRGGAGGGVRSPPPSVRPSLGSSPGLKLRPRPELRESLDGTFRKKKRKKIEKGDLIYFCYEQREEFYLWGGDVVAPASKPEPEKLRLKKNLKTMQLVSHITILLYFLSVYFSTRRSRLTTSSASSFVGVNVVMCAFVCLCVCWDTWKKQVVARLLEPNTSLRYHGYHVDVIIIIVSKYINNIIVIVVNNILHFVCVFMLFCWVFFTETL